MYCTNYNRPLFVFITLLCLFLLPDVSYAQTTSPCDNCDDGNPCTRDVCFLGRCYHIPIIGCTDTTIDCEDGDPCTINEWDPITRKCISRPNPNCDNDPYDKCILFPPHVRVECDDNRTLLDPSDDRFYFYITVKGDNTSDCYNIADDFQATCLPYNQEVGPFGPFPANGSDLYLNIFDQRSSNGNIGAIVKAPVSCVSTTCGLYVTSVKVGECSFNPASGVSEASLEVKVEWANASSGANLTVNIQGAAGRSPNQKMLSNVSKNGSATFIFQVLADGKMDKPITASFNYPYSCQEKVSFNAPEACRPGTCSLNISSVSVGSCSYNEQTSQSTSTVEVCVDWKNAPAGEKVIVSLGGQNKVIATTNGNAGCTTFTVPANGAKRNPVSAYFQTSTSCKDTDIYDAPNPCLPLPECSLNITSVEVGSCTYSQGSSTATVKVCFDWSNDLISTDVDHTYTDKIVVALNGQNKEANVTTINGSTCLEFQVPANGSVNNSIAAYFKKSAGCNDADTYNAPTSCPPPPPCSLVITSVTESVCRYDNGQSVASVEVCVNWNNAPAGENIIIELNGEQKTITANNINGNGCKTFTVPANSTSGNMVTASFQTSTECNDTDTYDAPAPCNGDCPDLTSDDCLPQVSALFEGCGKVTVCSAKDLSNVVLDLGEAGFQNFDTDIRYEGLSGYTLMFTSDTPIRGIWIKSGCNQSDDCPGCGEYVANPNYPCVIDNCPNDPNKTEPGICGCGTPDDDTDVDGVADCFDICEGGDDNADSDGDGTPDFCDVEECDGVDNDGDGLIDEGFDADGDGVADCFDICEGGDDNADSDGDGTPDFCDVEECDGVDNDGDGLIDEDVCEPEEDCDADELEECEIEIVWTCNSVKICLGKDISNVVVDLGTPGFQNTDYKDETIDEQTWSYTAPAGQTIQGVWVKTADFCGKCTDNPEVFGYNGGGSGEQCPSGNGGGRYFDNPNNCSSLIGDVALLQNNKPANLPTTLPINGSASAKTLHVFPNPAVNELNVDLSAYSGKSARMFIYNSVGQLQRMIEMDEIATDLTRIDISNLTGDLYFLKVQIANEEVRTQKFVVKH